MIRLAALALVLCACKSNEDYKQQQPPPDEPTRAAPAADRPAPPPPKKELTPEELGSCELEASGAIKATQTSPGGRPATNISYWFTEAERQNMMGVDGFVVNCHGKDIKFSILPGGGKQDGMPFGPKKYTFTKGRGDANVMVTFGPKHTMGDPNGTVDITRFDKQRIVGTIDLTGTLMPGKGQVKLVGKFDFACPGFSGCER
jgi:hypothetical protein